MPGMSGVELAARLAEMLPGLRTLYTSGYTDHAIFQRGVLAPGAHFIEKPYSVEALARTVRRVLDEEPRAG